MRPQNIDISINVEPDIYSFLDDYKSKYINVDRLFNNCYNLIASGKRDFHILKDDIHVISRSDNCSSSLEYTLMLLFTREAIKSQNQINVSINIFAISLHDKTSNEYFNITTRNK